MNATQMKPRWGTYILADLSQYLGKGKFRGRKWYGQDTETGRNRSAYKGNFRGRTWNGQDTETGRNGSVYKGNFREGVFHGHGTYTFGKGEFEGQKLIGQFNDGAAWNVTEYDSSGAVTAIWVEGVRSPD